MTADEKLTALDELVELVNYHLRREPVMDREIYRMQSVQGFAANYNRWKERWQIILE